MPRASLHAFAFIVTLAWPVPLPADPAVLKPKPSPLPFEYEPAPEPLPNYVSGARWGTQSDPIRTMQKPLPPAVSATRLLLPDHFESHLFASEPEILKPICMAWDERGRLWIAETVDYPNELRSAGEGRDRIRICEDADGDGRADRFTLFADKLSIPTSMVIVQGGVIVAQAPDMLLLRDTDGDDRADERKVLFTGWGTFDTHAGPSNLRWGFDNWIWGVVGYSGFDGTVGGKSIKFGMGFFRFKPDGSQLEFVRSSNNNTWGLGFAEDGTLFGSTANGNPSMYMPIPNRMYEQVSGWSASRLESIATNMHIYPSTPKVRQVDWHDRYTAGAGHALYTARSFPREYWNRRAFVCEPTGHLIGMFDLVADGADFVAQNLGSFLASDDEWTSPIAAEVGPDGALWLIDWYNYIIQHNPVPHGFKNGKGNAYETGLRDKRHGRIYRITHKAGKPTPQPRLHGGSPNDWVKALSNENMLWRMHAQRLIVEKKANETVPKLIKLVKNRSVDELGFNLGALHALRTLQGLEAPELGSVAGEALTHPSSGVKRAALDALPRNARSVQAILEKEALHDPNDQVRLAALLALAEMPPDVSAGVMTHLVAGNVRTHRSRWLREAAACAGAKHADGFLQALVAKRPSSIPAGVVEIVGVVVRHRCLTAGTEELLELATSMNGASRS
ncbi:MAG: glycosyl hydrolase, partial [Verrucomicrobia bacterium]|nr:glycosyl hydrolase [Verrucomicrobiota bacterium]